MGWLSFILLLDLVNNKSVPQVVDTGIVIVDKNNIDSYASEMRKIIDKY
jgi:ABC-type sugar transport system substrate-binding protein